MGHGPEMFAASLGMFGSGLVVRTGRCSSTGSISLKDRLLLSLLGKGRGPRRGEIGCTLV